MNTCKPIKNISVIIPCYRCADTIERAVESIWNQTQLPYEVILVEDCSDDDQLTAEALRRIAKKYPNEFIHTIFLDNNHGPGYARNVGWEKANGKYIAFLDADDAWHPQKVEIQYEYMEKEKAIDISGHKCKKFSRLKAENVFDKKISPNVVELKDMFISNRFYTRTVMLRNNIRNRFDDGMYRAEDFLLWCEILSSGHKGAVLDLELAYVFDNENNSLSSSLHAMEKGELSAYEKLRKKNIISRGEYFGYCSFSYMKYMRRILKCMLAKKS